MGKLKNEVQSYAAAIHKNPNVLQLYENPGVLPRKSNFCTEKEISEKKERKKRST